jgi:hypothetical protein
MIKTPRSDKIRGNRWKDRQNRPVGALVTLDLPADSPVQNLPWIITIGPMTDDEQWEPVVCGPYERPHALALAGAVVADEDLMAVVEPLLPLADVEAIRDEIELAQSATDTDPDDEFLDDEDPAGEHETRHVEPGVPPTGDEVRAGFARIAAGLTAR